MNFQEPFRVFTRHPNFWMNWLFLGLCFLIPFVGPIVASGWLFRCFVAWQQDREMPAFDFNFFGDYLKEGLWPFLVSLVYGLAMMVVVMPIFFVATFALIPLMEETGGEPALFVVLILGIIVLELLAMMVFSLITSPGILNSGLRQNFSAGFDRTFVTGFLKRSWKHLLVAELVFFLLMIPAVLVGYLALFVGVYFTMSFMMFVRWHLHFQIYREYLAKGGEEIPIHPVFTTGTTPPTLPPAL